MHTHLIDIHSFSSVVCRAVASYLMHIWALSLPYSRKCSGMPSYNVMILLPRIHTPSRTHTVTHTLTHTHTHTHTLTHPHTHSHTYTLAHTLTPSHTPSDTHTHTHTLAHTYTHTFTHSHFHTHTQIMEFCNGGDMKTLLSIYGLFSVDMALYYVAQTVLGLTYLHSRGIIHRFNHTHTHTHTLMYRHS